MTNPSTPRLRVPCVAYFCMEYGLQESFPIYAGGLGILAGDYIKAARDLQAPMVAVGLLGERGYGGRPPRRAARRVSLYYGVRTADLAAGVEDFRGAGLDNRSGLVPDLEP